MSKDTQTPEQYAKDLFTQHYNIVKSSHEAFSAEKSEGQELVYSHAAKNASILTVKKLMTDNHVFMRNVYHELMDI
jgi:hypothetical protein